ncbi:MAG: polyprenyl synthetase family protein [Candidatus Omnitrophica bacterium]|nr:polyprenyl synthetase family protein [Candidatus Omnitrophota bacterium]
MEGIKNTIEKELRAYSRRLDSGYRLTSLSPLLASRLKEFILRPGKRLRPSLFVLGYKAYARRPAPGLYRSALSFELLHDFMLIHDDIIDRSPLRRGKPSLHAMFERHFRPVRGVKASGADFALVCGDILYALAMEAFVSVKEKTARKEAALRKFIRAALFTGCGEFVELELASRPLERIREEEIYRVYDLKTAYYTFAYPLSVGATLAGAGRREADKIFEYGVCLGRAFQILDDILGMFATEKAIGKSVLTDLQESKKTLLVWYAYNRLSKRRKKDLLALLNKKKIGARDLTAMRLLLVDSGALDFARGRIQLLTKKAARLNAALDISNSHKRLLDRLSRTILA